MRRFLLLIVAAGLLVGCGANNTYSPTLEGAAAAPIAVTVTPSPATVAVGGSVSFTAHVTGSSNSAVSWSIPHGGGGSITQAGVYTAPATIGAPILFGVDVVATSAADPSKSGTAAVIVESSTLQGNIN